MRSRLLFLAVPFLAATLLRADAPPPVPSMDGLGQNGRSFLTTRRRVPIRCLDAPGLLGLPADEQAQLLDRAASAGFNSVSFEAPLVGPGGLSPELGKPNEGSQAAWVRVFEACELRRLYAFPVLWTPATVDALIGTATARDRFFAGRNALGWQAWALREALKVKVKGRPLGSSPVVGGWLLYRGPWPDGAPLPGKAVASTPSAQARLDGWARWQVTVARKAGLRQLLGVGLWAKSDLAADGAPAQADVVDIGDTVPLAPLSSPDLKVDTSQARAKALDVLPPVPGADAEFVGAVDDSDSVKAPPANPWDLEGLDWAQVEAGFEELPMAGQVDFLEFTQDTEDWYRVGERLADAVQHAEVPVLWRQDWRHASRYERNKRLAAPAPLAGLVGAWPSEDWPAAGEALWPVSEAPNPETSAFRFRSAKLVKEGGRLFIELELNKPATVTVRYGTALPLAKARNSPAKVRLHAEQKLPLDGVDPKKPFLIKVEALSGQGIQAQMRTRWVRAPQ